MTYTNGKFLSDIIHTAKNPFFYTKTERPINALIPGDGDSYHFRYIAHN